MRLKGGDPFVFGRGGEEALALREAGIPFEIVPGVTAGVAAAAYAGIPVTHRGLATARGARRPAHEERGDGRRGAGDLDWPALAAFPGTLVFYMGVRQLPQIAESLIAAGRRASEPVGDRRTGHAPRPAHRHRDARRHRRGRAARGGPSRRRSRSSAPSPGSPGSWSGCAAPAERTTVAVTRARAQASGLARRLAELGASVVQAPVIRIEPLARPAARPRRRTTSSASPAPTR